MIYKVEKRSTRTLNFFVIFFFQFWSAIFLKNMSQTYYVVPNVLKEKLTKYEEFRNKFEINDIWGDFNIIFASSFIGEKIIDLPVRYYERVQGESKM